MTIDQFMWACKSEFHLHPYQREWLEGLLVEYGRSVIERCAELVESRIKHAGSKEDPFVDDTDVVLDLIVADLKGMKS